MAGIYDRVQGFLDSWPKVKEQLEELTEAEEDERLFYGDGVSGSFRCVCENDLPEIVGEGDTGL